MPERETRTERVPVDEALSLSGKSLKIKSPSIVPQHIVLRSGLQDKRDTALLIRMKVTFAHQLIYQKRR
jgi:hypothetical protein